MTDSIDPSPEARQAGEPAYHLLLDGDEQALAARALRLLISNEAHEPLLRSIAREVLAELERQPPAGESLVVPLSAPGMKLTHTAVKLLLDDMRRDQAAEQHVLRAILDKLPDEHAIRAIVIE